MPPRPNASLGLATCFGQADARGGCDRIALFPVIAGCIPGAVAGRAIGAESAAAGPLQHSSTSRRWPDLRGRGAGGRADARARHHFDTSAKTPFLLLFFASIGLTADLAVLRRGGTRLLRFVIVLFPFLLAQDALGVVIARLIGLHPVLGLVAGSITLAGGHGTGAAYAERFAAEYEILGVMGLTMTSATIGLILGGIIGGPVAERLVRRTSPPDAAIAAAHGGVVGGPVSTPVTTVSFTSSFAAALGGLSPARLLGALWRVVPSWCRRSCGA
jgi:hypothetical protein